MVNSTRLAVFTLIAAGVAVLATGTATAQVIDGIACGGSVQLTESGHLYACMLDRETSFGRLRLPAGTHVVPDPAFHPAEAFLPHDWTICGHLLRGRGLDYRTTFHANGRVQSAHLARPELIQGAPCAASASDAVTFYDNGHLESCVISEDVSIEGRSFERGLRIHFDHDARNPRAER